MRNAFARVMTELANERNDVCLLSGDIGNRMFDKYKEHMSRFCLLFRACSSPDSRYLPSD